MQRFEQDGDVFEFPDDCAVISAYDDQPFFKKLSGNHAIEAKGCDIVMVHGSTLWLIEAKDYDRKEMARTRPNSADLARTIARKGFDTLAGLQVGARYVPDERTAWICHQAVDCARVELCATVEPTKKLHMAGRDREYMKAVKEQLERNAKGYADRVRVTSNRDDAQWKLWKSWKA